MASIASANLSRAQTNRANAEHSTGPRTDSGKQRSSQNALKHGLNSAKPRAALRGLGRLQPPCPAISR
jgi:hypothetical protein